MATCSFLIVRDKAVGDKNIILIRDGQWYVLKVYQYHNCIKKLRFDDKGQAVRAFDEIVTTTY